MALGGKRTLSQCVEHLVQRWTGYQQNIVDELTEQCSNITSFFCSRSLLASIDSVHHLKTMSEIKLSY